MAEQKVECEGYCQRRNLLFECMARLSDEQRELLYRAYEGTITIRQLAAELQRLPQTVYNRLNSIRRLLLACVEEAMQHKGTREP